MAQDSKSHGIRLFSGMVFFIIIAAFLWLVIKLSNTYTVTESFAIHYTDIPADQIIPNSNYSVEATMTTTGFKLLNYYFRSNRNRKIEISLNTVNYKKSNFETYSYNSKFLEEAIADFIASNTSDVKVAEENQYFVMSKLASKRVKIVPQTDIAFERQYNYYGEPVAFPDSATIFGPAIELEKIQTLPTEVISSKNVNRTIETNAKVKVSGDIRCDISEVNILVNVEKFTEAEVTIPITQPAGVNLHLYPNKVKIRYIVAMKDYAIINEMSFRATIDKDDIYTSETLPVKLELSPSNTQILGLNPQEVEYIVVQ